MFIEILCASFYTSLIFWTNKKRRKFARWQNLKYSCFCSFFFWNIRSKVFFGVFISLDTSFVFRTAILDYKFVNINCWRFSRKIKNDESKRIFTGYQINLLKLSDACNNIETNFVNSDKNLISIWFGLKRVMISNDSRNELNTYRTFFGLHKRTRKANRNNLKENIDSTSLLKWTKWLTKTKINNDFNEVNIVIYCGHWPVF